MADSRKNQVTVSYDDQPGGILSLLQCGPSSMRCVSGHPDEVNFDVNPTGLYIAVHTKQWDIAVDRVKLYPKEASIWVVRLGESDPQDASSPPMSPTTNGFLSLTNTKRVIRWRMLPLHAAILFNGPVSVVKALLKVYPGACQCRDDQGMLPLHLAFRSGVSEEIVLALLEHFPDAIEIGDYKNRVPSMVSPKESLEYFDVLAEAVLKGHSHYYHAVRVAAADRLQNETNRTSTLKQMEEDRKIESEKSKEMFDNTQKQLQDEIDILLLENSELKERMAWYETKYDGAEEKEKVLVDHTNSLAERLRLTSLSEEHLATKLAKYETKLKVLECDFETFRENAEDEKASLEEQNTELSTALESMQHKAEILTENLQKKIEELNETKIRFEKERKMFEKQIDASKECLMELIASSKEDKKMFDEDSKELRQQLMAIQSELQKSSQIPKSLEDRLEILQREVANTTAKVLEDKPVAFQQEVVYSRSYISVDPPEAEAPSSKQNAIEQASKNQQVDNNTDPEGINIKSIIPVVEDATEIESQSMEQEEPEEVSQHQPSKQTDINQVSQTEQTNERVDNTVDRQDTTGAQVPNSKQMIFRRLPPNSQNDRQVITRVNIKDSSEVEVQASKPVIFHGRFSRPPPTNHVVDDTPFDEYVSTSFRQETDTRDDVPVDESNFDSTKAVEKMSEQQRAALESLDLGGSKDEIAATLSKIPGLTITQVKLLVDVASSLSG